MAGRKERTASVATLPGALEILEKREKEGDFGYEQLQTLEYARKFSKTSTGSSEKMMKELQALGVSEKISASIVNVMPIDVLQLKQILANEKKALEPEVADKAMAVIEANRSKG